MSSETMGSNNSTTKTEDQVVESSKNVEETKTENVEIVDEPVKSIDAKGEDSSEKKSDEKPVEEKKDEEKVDENKMDVEKDDSEKKDSEVDENKSNASEGTICFSFPFGEC